MIAGIRQVDQVATLDGRQLKAFYTLCREILGITYPIYEILQANLCVEGTVELKEPCPARGVQLPPGLVGRPVEEDSRVPRSTLRRGDIVTYKAALPLADALRSR